MIPELETSNPGAFSIPAIRIGANPEALIIRPFARFGRMPLAPIASHRAPPFRKM
jgi:hypothetical protein